MASPVRVYCDTGGFRPELSQLEAAGKIVLYQFKYENKNRHIKQMARPSSSSWAQVNYKWSEFDQSWESSGDQSAKFQEILAIVGAGNRTDAQHLDSAYMSQCSHFLTSDKGDIWSKRVELKLVIGVSVFHCTEDWEMFLEGLSADND